MCWLRSGAASATSATQLQCRIASENRYIERSDVRKDGDLSPGSGTAGNNWPEVRLAGGNGSEDDVAGGRMERGGGRGGGRVERRGMTVGRTGVLASDAVSTAAAVRYQATECRTSASGHIPPRTPVPT